MNKNYVCNNRKCRTPERGNEIRERPILFNGPMVRAILEGRKSMTRRVVKPVPSDVWGHGVVTDTRSTKFGKFCVHMRGEFCGDVHVDCPYGTPGDRLWVRETFRIESVGTHVPVKIPYEDVGIVYAADGEKRNIHREYPSALSSACHNNKPSIFMPRWASRITLEVTGVRVERLLEISEQDAIAEGVQWPKYDDFEPVTIDGVTSGPARIAFKELWSNINGAASWYSNPWVWVVEFRRVER